MLISELKKRGKVAHFSGHKYHTGVSHQSALLATKCGQNALAYSCKDPVMSGLLKSEKRQVNRDSGKSKL